MDLSVIKQLVVEGDAANKQRHGELVIGAVFLEGFGNLGGQALAPITGNLVFLMVFSAPALTMRLVSDELRMGTMELILTAPVRDWSW